MAQKNCCARLTSQVIGKQALLAQLARKAVHAQARGRNTAKLQIQIQQTKEDIVRTKAMVADHEAEHAEEPVSA